MHAPPDEVDANIIERDFARPTNTARLHRAQGSSEPITVASTSSGTKRVAHRLGRAVQMRFARLVMASVRSGVGGTATVAMHDRAESAAAPT